jgi:hypothetical protein
VTGDEAPTKLLLRSHPVLAVVAAVIGVAGSGAGRDRGRPARTTAPGRAGGGRGTTRQPAGQRIRPGEAVRFAGGNGFRGPGEAPLRDRREARAQLRPAVGRRGQQIARFPAIKALVYFDSPNAPKGDTRPDSSQPALAAFRRLAESTLFSVTL